MKNDPLIILTKKLSALFDSVVFTPERAAKRAAIVERLGLNDAAYFGVPNFRAVLRWHEAEESGEKRRIPMRYSESGSTSIDPSIVQRLAQGHTP